MRIPRASALATLFVLAGCQPADSPGDGAGPPPGSEFEGAAFEFEEVVPGVYHARGSGSLSVGSHGAVIVNEEDVLLVESHISPAAAHAVVGHEVTREMLESGASLGRSYELYVGGLPDQIAGLEGALDELQGSVDEAEDEAAREEAANRLAQMESRLAYMRNYAAGQEGMMPTGPNTTLSERLTLFRGDREIRILFFGRGHTGGDVVVHLPQERVIVTGDLLVPGLPYMGDGYLAEWVETLEHVKALDFDWVLPGHGQPFQDKERITYLQDYMRDLQARAAELHAQGMSYEEAAAQIDMTDHAEHYPQITGPGVSAVAVLRVFELLDGGS